MSCCPSWLSLENDFKCPVCHGSLKATKDQIQCNVCCRVYPIKEGILYFVDLGRLDDFEIEESAFHSKIAQEADEAHGQSTLRAQYLHQSFLSPLLALPKESLILDIACGTGVDLVELASKGYHVVGFDIAPGMVAIAQKKARECDVLDRVFLCVANACQLPFRTERFRAGYICAALHHMREPQSVLIEIARVLQPGGVLSIGSEPNAWIYKFRSLKHSRLGRWLMRLLRDDYTVGDQPPGDRQTSGWSPGDWHRVVHGTCLHLVEINPVWYLNGIASLLGFHSLPQWLEARMCQMDNLFARIPLVRNLSMKWNVVAVKR